MKNNKKNTDLPLVSIVVPTYNSSSTLDKVLASISSQTYPPKKIEVLVIDGGSSDNTLEIARKYKAKVLDNPKQHQVYAKHLGQMKSSGKYIVHLDSDEVMESSKSIENKVNILLANKKVKACVPSGHKTPKNVSGVNYIINEFGDPFSYYMYGFSFNSKFFINQLVSKYKKIEESKDFVVVDFEKSKYLPGIEMSASGMMLDRIYLLKMFPKIKRYPRLISQTFYFLVERGDFVGFTKNDPILHYSASSWSKYLKKLNSRVLNNIHKTEMGKSAFSGRGGYYSSFFVIKKYLFIPYSFTLLFPTIEGLRLSLTRRNLVFMSFPFLCIYISILIIYYSFLKSLGVKNKIRGYGI